LALKCPNCGVSFQPQFNSHIIGLNKKKVNVIVFYQLCLECDEPIIGYRDQKPHEVIPQDVIMDENDVQNLTMMVKMV
jgi:uncharacterized protein with PIN domain